MPLRDVIKMGTYLISKVLILLLSYTINLGLILTFFSLVIKKEIERIKNKKYVIILVFIILLLVDLVHIFVFHKKFPCVASDGWYDVYTSHEITKLDFSYFIRQYKYGYGYPFTFAFFLKFIGLENSLYVFSMFFFDINLILIFLISFIKSENILFSIAIALLYAFNPLVIRHTSYLLGKQIFVQTFLSLTLFFLFSYFQFTSKTYRIYSLFGVVSSIVFLSTVKSEFLLLSFVPTLIFIKDYKKLRVFKDHKNLIFLLLVILVMLPSIYFFKRQYQCSKAPGENLRWESVYNLMSYEEKNIKVIFQKVFLYFSFFPLFFILELKNSYIKYFLLILTIGIFPYAVYYPWIFESRYLSYFSPLFILLSFMPLIPSRNSKQNKEKKIIAVFLIILAMVNYLWVTKHTHLYPQIECMEQNIEIYKDIVNNLGNDSIYIVPRTNQEMILLSLGADADSFEMIRKYINRDIYENFYVKKIDSCNVTYPFILNFSRPVYFINSYVCNCTDCVEGYLCNCILHTYNSSCFNFKGLKICNITYPLIQSK